VNFKDNKFVLVELLRFISAMSVLIWHYIHFSYLSYNSVNYNKNELPFTEILRVFYEMGGAGVLIFWCISGFIFFYKYESLISLKKVSIKKFFINRFSRLYPLHFFTLISVLLLQIFFQNLNGNFFVYENNDYYHFFLQLLFISNWGFEKGYSFNGPIWSVSIEIIVYFIFYIFLRIFGKHLIMNISIIIICVSIKLFSDTTYLLYDCVIFFYCGGLSFIFTKYLSKKKILNYFHSYYYLLIILSLPFLCWYYNIYKIKYFYFIFFVIFSCCTLLFCSKNLESNQLFSKIAVRLGNLTYGSYLLHFPFQLLIVLSFRYFDLDIPIYNNWFFVFYIIGVLTLSYFSYKKLEMPLQNYIRNY
tara:strand:+ start:333 stop:1412 length:1080 start_codon:yes stop_codon:yes gene_type:complete